MSRWFRVAMALVASFGAAVSCGGETAPCGGVDMSSDPTNCGACGNVCPPVRFASHLSSSSFEGGRAHLWEGFAVDGSNAYWTTSGPGVIRGSLMKVSLSGGTPTVLMKDTQTRPERIALDSTHVYWTAREPSDEPGTGVVMKMPLGGGGPVLLAGGLRRPRNIAVDSTNVYWTTHGDSLGGGAVMKVPLPGGTPITLATNLDFSNAIAVSSTHVYLAAKGLLKVPLDGGAVTVIDSGDVFSVVTDATRVYWVVGGILKVAPLAGGSPTVLAAISPDRSLCVGPNGVYGMLGDDVVRVPLGGGTATRLASTADTIIPTRVAIGPTGTYWISEPDAIVLERFDEHACASAICGCAAPTLLCSDTCVDPGTDPTNCGGCGNRCADGEACVDGACQCLGAMCNGSCEDTSSDPDNCGTCGNRCSAPNTCLSGSCQCARTDCSGTCADLMTSVEHCGACGQACPVGATCLAGECGTCATGQPCGGVCVNVQADPWNCGACGVTCDAQSICWNGACVLNGLYCDGEFCPNNGYFFACCTAAGSCGLDFGQALAEPLRGCLAWTDAPTDPTCPLLDGLSDGCCVNGVCGVRTTYGSTLDLPGLSTPVCLSVAATTSQQLCGGDGGASDAGSRDASAD